MGFRWRSARPADWLCIGDTTAPGRNGATINSIAVYEENEGPREKKPPVLPTLTPVWAEPTQVPCSCPQTLLQPQFKLERSLLRCSPAPRLQGASMGLSSCSTRRTEAWGGPREHPQCWQPGQGYATLDRGGEHHARVWHLLQGGSGLMALLEGEMITLKYQV